MERNFNIAEILKDKPKGTKLYADAFGELSIEEICTEDNHGITLSDNCGTDWLFYNDGKYSWLGESILVPSKEMRDWHKFAWKKGYVLVSNDSDSHIIFNGFSKNDYTTFEGKHWISVSKKRHVSCLKMQNVQDYHIEDNKDSAQTYINAIEKFCGGKLNLETLEIEKQPEFKDGDILYGEKDELHTDAIFILKIVKGKRNYYACLVLNPYMTCDYIGIGFAGNKTLRYATEEEKQKLFDALAKQGKAWDAEKKMIVDLNPKVDELKPFDKVLVKDNTYGSWEPALFWKKVDVKDLHPYKIIGGKRYRYCEPYEGNEHLLDNQKCGGLIMGNEDLTNCIPWYCKPHFKCEDIQDGKTQRRMRRKNQLRKRKGRL
mgnify:CR=1 FL=1